MISTVLWLLLTLVNISSKRNMQKNFFLNVSFLLAFWKSMMKIAGSGSASGSGSECGSICQRHGSADPDPHQNVMDPQHCFKVRWKDSKSTNVMWRGAYSLYQWDAKWPTICINDTVSPPYPMILHICFQMAKTKLFLRLRPNKDCGGWKIVLVAIFLTKHIFPNHPAKVNYFHLKLRNRQSGMTIVLIGQPGKRFSVPYPTAS